MNEVDGDLSNGGQTVSHKGVCPKNLVPRAFSKVLKTGDRAGPELASLNHQFVGHYCWRCDSNQIFANPSPSVQVGNTSESESRFESAATTIFTSS
jgi:hypothetical protein